MKISEDLQENFRLEIYGNKALLSKPTMVVYILGKAK